MDDYVSRVMEACGLPKYYKSRYPHEFSGGQRQRICIARALALNPDFIVCDEPVSALDVSIQAQVINLLRDLQREYGLTYLFISHDLSVVEHISDTLGVMYLGNIVEFAETEMLFSRPLHPYTRALLSAIPVPDPDYKMDRILLKGSIPSPTKPPNGCKFHTRCEECMDICTRVAPDFREIEPGHYCACHLYGGADTMSGVSAAHMPWYSDRASRREEGKMRLSRGEMRSVIAGALGASLLVALVFAGVFAGFILFLEMIVFK
ncbi:MAG: Oligopeptide transport ATP-binding protein OppF [Firmicutes bacterium ADurb.Bin467]|nr:MAG: Oligopeptide transport ATP-binding protein OppF [Firmicutes bacterium ADurb.Bin467]